MVMLGRMPLRVGLACQGDVEALPVGMFPRQPPCKSPFPSARGWGLVYTHVPHLSTSQRLPWELFLRGGGRRLWEGSGGRRSVFKWCLTPVHTMPFPFWGRRSISLFPGMRLEGPCPVGEWGGTGG